VGTVSASGYVPLNNPFTVNLRSGEERDRVNFVLTRRGAISGTVVDEHGEPLEGIRMRAFNVRRYGGRFRVLPESYPGEPTTDDRGRYRISDLTPGRYLLAASAAGDVSSGGAPQNAGYAPIYYPNSPDLSAAVPIVIEAEQQLQGMNIGFVPTPTFTVTGRVVGRLGPVPAQVTLALSARTGAASVFNRSVDVSEGTFVIRNVPIGDYVVQAQPRPVEGGGPFGVAYVRVTDADPAPVSLLMVERSTIEGRLVLETAADLAGLQLELVAISDDPDTDPLIRKYTLQTWQMTAEGVGTPNSSPPSFIDGTGRVVAGALRDSSFRISGLTGRNRFNFSAPLCRTCFIKSATVNGTDATDQPFDVGLTGQSFKNVEVVISDKGAIIEGRVLDEHDAPLEKFIVIVFSSFRDRWYHTSPYVLQARSAKDGTFTVPGLPPGEYMAALIRPDERAQSDAEVTDAAVLDPLMPFAQRLTVREGDRRSITLRPPRQ
jgi:hypothetical protein